MVDDQKEDHDFNDRRDVVLPGRVGCKFVMFRGAVTGRVITCGVCSWCRDPANAERFTAPDAEAQP